MTVPLRLVSTTSFVPTVPAGIVSVTDVEVFADRTAATPPIVEDVREARLVPVITVVPPPEITDVATEILVAVGGVRYA